MNKTFHNSLERVDSRETGLSDFVDFAHPDLFHKTRAFARFLEDGRERGYETYVRRLACRENDTSIGANEPSKHFLQFGM